MRIAYLGIKGLPSKGGAERVAEAIIRRLAGRHELTVYCNARYTPEDTRIEGVRLIRIPTLPGKHLQAMSLFVLSTLHALLGGGYDLVHVHNVEACFILLLLRLRYRAMATAHGSTTRAIRSKWGPVARALMALTEYPFLYLSNLTTSVSRVDAEHMDRRYGKKVLYLPNGVEELPTASPGAVAATLREIGVEDGKYILFAAGRIEPTKGCHLVVEAFRQLSTDMRLVVVGDLGHVPQYARRLREMANDRVVFVPLIASREKLFGIVRHCRLFVFPSTVEAMSMMLLEVASLGVPLICSDIPDNQYVLGSHALYFRSEDAEDLAEKIRWALLHPDAMGQRALEARAWVEGTYSWEKIVERYDDLYNELAGPRTRNQTDSREKEYGRSLHGGSAE